MNLIDPSLITVGAILKTRDGRKARVICTDRKSKDFPIIAILDNGEDEVTCTYRVDGCQLIGYESPADLISVWTEVPEVEWSVIRPWLNWVAKDADGHWWAYEDMPEIPEDWDMWHNASEGYNLMIPYAYAPKFTGCYRDSLVKRPIKN